MPMSNITGYLAGVLAAFSDAPVVVESFKQIGSTDNWLLMYNYAATPSQLVTPANSDALSAQVRSDPDNTFGIYAIEAVTASPTSSPLTTAAPSSTSSPSTSAPDTLSPSTSAMPTSASPVTSAAAPTSSTQSPATTLAPGTTLAPAVSSAPATTQPTASGASTLSPTLSNASQSPSPQPAAATATTAQPSVPRVGGTSTLQPSAIDVGLPTLEPGLSMRPLPLTPAPTRQ